MQAKNYIQSMADGTQIAVNAWLPDEVEKAKGVIVLVHGMCEHSLRYDRTASIIADKGFVVVAHDQRGHGKTASIAELAGTGMFGLLDKKDGFQKVVSDLAAIIDKAATDYKGKPITLWGHSFGSFVAKAYIENPENKGKVRACVLCGTSGKMNGLAKEGLTLIRFMEMFHKKEYKSKFVQRTIFAHCLKRIENPKTGMEWLSKNQMNLDMYQNDSWCGGVATLSFYFDMLKAVISVNRTHALSLIDKDLPVNIISGEEDPIGDYGKGVTKLFETLKALGLKHVAIKLYSGDRHEILNELDADRVIEDTLEWIEENTL